MRIPSLLLLLLLFSGIGCANYRPFNWFPAGTISQQQQAATLHDPYPNNDIGPEMVGLRPREFAKPLAEPVRNSQFGNYLPRP
ncbi:MAG: membrane or secreted protein [Pirellulaceae bacterium]|nr:membrane or secreted protein [Pirellulaceae bacterium]